MKSTKPLLYEIMPEYPDFEAGGKWHPLSSPPLAGGDRGGGKGINGT